MCHALPTLPAAGWVRVSSGVATGPRLDEVKTGIGPQARDLACEPAPLELAALALSCGLAAGVVRLLCLRTARNVPHSSSCPSSPSPWSFTRSPGGTGTARKPEPPT